MEHFDDFKILGQETTVYFAGRYGRRCVHDNKITWWWLISTVNGFKIDGLMTDEMSDILEQQYKSK